VTPAHTVEAARSALELDVDRRADDRQRFNKTARAVNDTNTPLSHVPFGLNPGTPTSEETRIVNSVRVSGCLEMKSRYEQLDHKLN